MAKEAQKNVAMIAGLAIAVSSTVAIAPAAQAQPVNPVSEELYLQDAWQESPRTVEGNLSDAATCDMHWVAQAVYSAQMQRDYGGSASTNGFLQSVRGGQEPTGVLELQHYTVGANPSQVEWRIPVAVDQQVDDAKLVIHFNDEDYDQAWAESLARSAITQQSGWWNAPGANPDYPEGRTWLERFTGVSGYAPLSPEGLNLPVTVNNAARTITVDLGQMPAGTSTVILFSAKTADATNPNAANNDEAYGLMATVDGTPADCTPAPEEEPGDQPGDDETPGGSLGSTGSLGSAGLGSLEGSGDGSVSGGSTGSSGSLGDVIDGSTGPDGGNGSLSISGLGSLEGAGDGSVSGGPTGIGGSSAGSLALGSLLLGGLGIGGLIWAAGNGMISLPPGIVVPPFLASIFPALQQGPSNEASPAHPPVAPGPQVNNGRG